MGAELQGKERVQMSIATMIRTNSGVDHIPANIHHGAYLKRQMEQNSDVYRQELANELAVADYLGALFFLVLIGGSITGLVVLVKWMLGM